ncbi:phage tail protein [Thiocapsa marina]|uniref:Phage tail protein n=1 Tax=Thiocapsa marina 5811 TaxID=768671 RepID=F9U9L3_9GAMM|nr:phage tail protein [Thiocapsa marina]EGV18811.1 Conserved hypothetical protein CHP02241, phage tail region protein [Thiocapsa marina 5811]
MAATGDKQEQPWPLPKFYFSVSVSGDVAQFHEVSGLDMEAQVIEYRHGDSKEFAPVKMPGLKKFSNVTLKKGVFAADNKFFDWINEIRLNTIARRDVVIALLNEAQQPVQVWSLKQAWPTKIVGTDFKSDANEAAIETLELAHEGLTVQTK